MARLTVLLATIGSLVAGACAHEQHPQHPQHVLTGPSRAGEPSAKAAEVIRERLKLAEIIPTVLDDFVPSLDLHVTWSFWERALLGNTLPPEKLQDEPTIALHDILAAASSAPKNARAANVTYAITLTDPDAPSRDEPDWSEFCHWVASGVLKPGLCDPKEPAPCVPVLADLDEVVPYKPPGPPPGTGSHRYVFVAFVPSNGTTDRLHLSRPAARKRWGYGETGCDGGSHQHDHHTKGAREWAAENGLAAVGANFIYAKNKQQ